MPAAPTWLPALTLQLQLAGLSTLGLDSESVRAHLGPLPAAGEALVPVSTYLTMWKEAERLYGRRGLPSALALVIPYGAFGALDYLAGSAATVGGACESAMLHFSMVAADLGLEIDSIGDGARVLRVRPFVEVPAQGLEFTLAAVASRLRHVTEGRFEPRMVGLPDARPMDDAVRSRLYGQAPMYQNTCAEMVIDGESWRLTIRGADSFLHATLTEMAAKLQLTRPEDSTLERALRARLRDALAQGSADVGRMAQLLGVSERTLQRRLSELGRRFGEVVDDFRREEAVRLIAMPGMNLVEVAGRLGYSEQTSFTRAFRRWTGSTPTTWRARQLA